MRRFPRNAQSRADALSGKGNLFQHYRRDTLGRKSEDARNTLSAAGAVAVTASGTAHACNESDIVAGGKVLTLTMTGPDKFTNDDSFAALIAAFPAALTGLTAAAFVHNQNVITVTLPAVAAYDISVNASYDIAIPVSYFRASNVGQTVTAAIVVTAGA